MKKYRGNSGFTMMEMLVAVGILVALMGLGFIAVINYQKSMKQLELDKTSQEIFIAAQNHLTVAKSQGLLEGMSEDKRGFNNEKSTDGDEVYCFFVAPKELLNTRDDLLNVMLPRFSIDDTVRIGGSYAIEYNYKTATVLNVFYSDQSNLSTHTFDSSKDMDALFPSLTGEGAKDARLNYENTIIGWYGGAGLDLKDPVELKQPEMKILNAEKLQVLFSVDGYKTDSIPDGTMIQVIMRGDTSGSERVLEKGLLFTVLSQSKQVTLDGTTWRYIVLDDITTKDMHFADQWCVEDSTNPANKPFIPGENLTIYAEVYNNKKASRYARSAKKHTNSLFADVAQEKVDDENQNVAIISNIRHLENLDASISAYDLKKLDKAGATRAKQTTNLQWIGGSDAFTNMIRCNDKRRAGSDVDANNVMVYKIGNSTTEAGKYAPVYPKSNGEDYALTYDGGGFKVSNVAIDNKSAAEAGMFGAVTGGDLKNIHLVDFKVKTTLGGDAGTLAGKLTNTNVSNVRAYDAQAPSGGTDDRGVITAGNAGGLVGAFVNQNAKTTPTITNSSASVYVKSSGTGDSASAGGLVGRTTGVTAIEKSYAGAHTVNGAYLNETPSADNTTKVGRINVQAEVEAGGLVGKAANAITISNSYATASAYGATVGGFVGSAAAGSTFSNSYATGLVIGKDENATRGTFAGSVENVTNETFNKDKYLAIVSQDVDSTLTERTARTALGSGNNDNIVAADRDLDSYRSFYSVRFSADEGSDAANSKQKAAPYDSTLAQDFNNQYPYKSCDELSDAATEAESTHYGDWPKVETKVVNTRSSASVPRAATLRTGHVSASTSFAPKQDSVTKRATINAAKESANARPMARIGELVNSAISSWLSQVRAEVAGSPAASSSKGDESKDSDAEGDNKPAANSNSSSASSASNTNDPAATNSSNSSTAPDAQKQDSPEPSAEVEAPAVEAESAVKVLEKTITSVDGRLYTVRVTYGENANIPDEAELSVKEVNQRPADFFDEDKRDTYKDRPRATELLVDEQNMQDRVSTLTQALELKDGDLLMWNKLLSVSIMLDGEAIAPSEDVTVEVETNALPATASDTLEAVTLNNGDANRLAVSNTTGKAKGEAEKKSEELPSRISFTTNVLGDMGLAQVSEEKFAWSMQDNRVYAYGARSVKASPFETATDLKIADDRHIVEVFSIAVDPTHPFDTTLWISAARDGGATRHDSVTGYLVTDDGLKQLFSTVTADGLVPVKAKDTIALVWESGYHQMALKEGGVSVVGEVPEGVTISAEDVYSQYSDPAKLGKEASTPQTKVAAAYTITMKDAQGAAYKPDAEHPIIASVANLPEYAKDVTVLRVEGNGATKVPSQKQDNGPATFVAADSGTYVVTYTVQAYHKEVKGDAWKVSADYTEEAGIPGDAELVARELSDKEYEAYIKEAAAAVGKDPKDVKVTKAFDISFKKGDTEYHELDKSVRVTIDLVDQSIAKGTQVVHMDQEPTVKVSDVKDGNLSFNSSEFSPFLLLQGDGDLASGEVAINFVNGENVTTVNVQNGQPIGDAIPAGPTKDGYTFKGWYAVGSETPITAQSTFTESTSLYAKFAYTVTFAAEGVTPLPDPIEKFEGEAVGTLPSVSKDGYRFDGWYYRVEGEQEDKKAEASTVFTGNTTLTAKFVEQVTVAFVADGVQKDTKTIDKGTAIGTLPDGTAEGCTFVGWFVGGETEPITAETTFNESTTVTAHYTVTVTFVVKNADYTQTTSETPETINKGEAIGTKIPGDPVLQGYAFKGWFIEGTDGKPTDQQVSATTTFSAHTRVVAKFIKQVTIAFYDKEGDTLHLRQKFVVDEGESVDLIENPNKDGYRFDGWFEETVRRTNALGITDESGNLVDENGQPLAEGATPVRKIKATRDMNLTSEFVEQITVRFLVVDFVNRSDSTGLPSVNVHYHKNMDKTDGGAEVNPYPTNPAMSGYEFQGWYKIKQYGSYEHYGDVPAIERETQGVFVLDNNVSGTPYVLDEAAPVAKTDKYTSSTDVVAKFTKKVNITFQYDGKQSTVEYLAGENLSAHIPADAPKQGYRLEWYRGDTKVEDGYTVKDEDDNAIFTARYIEQSTVTFKVGDTEVGTLTIDKGTSVQESGKDWPADPSNPDTSSSAVFIGWYDANNHEYKAESLITTNSLELTAQFGYTVNFFTEDNLTEPFTDSRKVQANAALGWLPTAPYKEGKSFKEWRIGTQVVDETHVVTSDTNIVAYYEDISLYTVIVNYVVDGDSDPTDTKILSVDKSSVAQDPVTVKSPESFKKSNENFYPVAQEIQIVQNGDTIGIAETHSEVRINETSGEDGPIVTITVPYKRADATYTVKHMLLNLNGTESSYNEQNYTEIESERVEGLVGVQGAFVTPTVKSSILEYANVSKVESGKINHASGDVFYVYYTRKNFTLTYETGDGSGINSVTRPYGTSISLSNETTREGFSFQGWYRTSEAAANLVASQKINGPLTLLSDTTVYAGWKAETVSYSIVYLFEKYNDAGTESSFVYDSSRNATATVGSTVRASSAPTITRKGWEKDTTRNNNSSVVIAADGTSVLYVYYKLTEYTFYFRPGSYYDYGNVTATLNGDTKTGNSNFSYTMTVKLGQDVSRTWPMNIGNASFIYGRYIYYPSFQGWSHPSGVVYVTKRTNVTADMLPDTGSSITYTASWLLNSEAYTVNYWLQNANDNNYTKSEVYSQVINSSTGGINLSAKDIIGYTYKKEKDDHVYSRYGYITTYNFYYDRETFKIDYYYGSNLLKTINKVKFDATLSSGAYNWTPTAAQCGVDSDYTFDGWYSDSGLTSKYTFTTMPASNLVLYAKWIAPEYTVKFHKNYDGAYNPAANDIYEQRTVTKGDKAGSITAPPAPDENTTFVGWFTSSESNDEIKPAGQNVEGNMHLYARWKPMEITQYKVYYQDEAGHDLLEPVTRHGRWPLGEEVSETAPYITGYTGHGFNEDDTLIYDESTKKLTLGANEADNKIVFVYKVKPSTIKYTVKYVLYSDKVTNVADPKTKEVDGSYTNVTETAATPTVAGYTDYYPTEVTKTLELGHDESKNVLTFYYTKGAKITVSYVDMEGDPIPSKSPIETYQEIGEAFNLDTALPGYTFARVEKNGEVTTETSFTPTKNTEVFDIKVYYKYNLSILARSRSRVYNGEALTDAGTYTNADDFAPLVSVSGLKEGHSLAGITIAGSQTDAGTSPSVASDAVITGFKNGMTAAAFYEISYPIGSLTVTPINVTISLEPDRWTGNIYDGEVKMTGFTNSAKAVGDYVKIDNSQFATVHLNNIWEGIKTYLKEHVEAEDYGKLLNDVDGLAVIKGKKDVGDYYEPAGTFEGALASAVSALNLGNNYKIVQYARECHLEILPLPVNIKTGAAEKSYDGTPLTNSELTIKTGVEGSQQTITPEEGSTDKFKLTKDGNLIIINTSGSQTTPGTSLNTYTIDWGTDKAENFSVTEELGELKVTKRAIIIAVQDDVKPLNLADPAPMVKVFYETTDGSGNTTRNEIPATLTHWSGDNYTIKLNDADHGYTDNLPITIAREDKSEKPGKYEVKVTPGEGAEENYDIRCESGWLTIAIARVSNGGANDWTYHEYLVNNGTGSQQGAFNRASGLSGKVIIETLCESAVVDSEDRYALPKGQNVASSQNLTIRTTQNSTWNPSGSGHFRSTISRDTANYGGGSMITLNQATSSLTISDLILDGGSNEGYVLEGGGNQVSGGAVNAKNGKSLLLQNVTVQNSYLCRTSYGSGINANGGGVYGGTDVSCTLNGVEFINCSVYATQKDKNGVSGGGAYLDCKNAVINCVTAVNCHADDDKGGAIYVYGENPTVGTSYEYEDVNGVKQKVDKPCVFENCSAKRGGGLHFFNKGGKVIGTAENKVSFIDCHATATNEYGGGLAINNGASQISYVDFTNCTSQNNGGGFGITGSCTNVSNITATDCTAKNGGGGLYLGNNSTITNVSINGHSLLQTGVANAKNGGGIFVNSGTLTLKGSAVIQNCDASSGGGGGIYVNNATAKLTEGTPNITNCTASVGGAIFATGGSANVQISTGSITNNTATGLGGGAMRLEGGANATISGNALIHSNKVTGSGEKFGGAVSIKKGKLTVSGGTISNNTIDVTGKEASGGAIHVSGYLPASASDEGELVITGGTISSNTVTSNQGVYGGAISLRGSTAMASISGGKIERNGIESTASNKNALGGAICVRDGGELTLTGGTLNNNTAIAKTDGNAKGAGIYIDDTSVNRIVDGATEEVVATLKISGHPVFGSGNNVNAVARSNYSSKLNGGEEVYTGDRARQDIFINEKNDDNPKSIEITGDLTWNNSSSNGTIWVWAEKEEHGKQLMPFAKISDDVVVGTESGNLNPEHLKVFRNARDDEWTENGTETYLFGTNEGADPGYAYWSGVSGRRQVILQKVGQNNMPLEGAQLTVYKGNATTPYSVTQPLENLESDKTGVFWVGEFIYGTYYLQETEAPNDSTYSGNQYKWYCLIVDEAGAFMSKDGYANEDSLVAKNAALADATAVKQATA